MKKILIVTLSLFFITFSNSYAQRSNLKIAVIDVEGVLKNSKVVKYIQDKIAKKEKIYQVQIDKKRKSLKKEMENIESRRSILSESAFEKEKTKFAKSFNKLRDELDSRQIILKTAYINSVTAVDKKINKIVMDISDKQNIDIIMPSSQIISYKDDLDISAQVLKRLNEEMTRVKIKFD